MRINEDFIDNVSSEEVSTSSEVEVTSDSTFKYAVAVRTTNRVGSSYAKITHRWFLKSLLKLPFINNAEEIPTEVPEFASDTFFTINGNEYKF